MNTNPSAKPILCFGDSNTWGQKPDKSGRYPADVRWTGVLQKTLGNAYYVIEEGLSSRTSDLDYAQKPGHNGKTYLEPCLDSHRPLYGVVLMLGTNDVKIEFNRTASDIGRAIKGLVELIHTKTKKDGAPAKVMVVSPILIDDTAPRFAEWYTGYYNHDSALNSRRLAAELERVAKECGCAFFDAATVAHAGDDGIHFSQDSHQALGQALRQAVEGL